MTESDLLRALADQFGDQPFGDTGLTVRGAVEAVLGDRAELRPALTAAGQQPPAAWVKIHGTPAGYVEGNAVGRRIQAARARLGVSQKELARRIGRTSSSVSYVERALGKPSPATTRKIAAALGVDPRELDPDIDGPGPGS